MNSTVKLPLLKSNSVNQQGSAGRKNTFHANSSECFEIKIILRRIRHKMKTNHWEEKKNNLTWTELIFESWFPDISSRMNQNVQKSLIVGNNFLSYCTWYFGPFSSEFYWILFHTIYIFLKKKITFARSHGTFRIMILWLS